MLQELRLSPWQHATQWHCPEQSLCDVSFGPTPYCTKMQCEMLSGLTKSHRRFWYLQNTERGCLPVAAPPPWPSGLWTEQATITQGAFDSGPGPATCDDSTDISSGKLRYAQKVPLAAPSPTTSTLAQITKPDMCSLAATCEGLQSACMGSNIYGSSLKSRCMVLDYC